MIELPHIRHRIDADGHAIVEMDDWEIYDYVDDHLTEEHDLEQLWCRHFEGRPWPYVIAYPGDCSPRIEEALARLDPPELQRIFLLYNSEYGT